MEIFFASDILNKAKLDFDLDNMFKFPKYFSLIPGSPPFIDVNIIIFGGEILSLLSCEFTTFKGKSSKHVEDRPVVVDLGNDEISLLVSVLITVIVVIVTVSEEGNSVILGVSLAVSDMGVVELDVFTGSSSSST